MTTIVCPYCQAGFRSTQDRCPKCQQRFDPGDWPVADAYSPRGRSPRLTIHWADNSWSPGSNDFLVGRSPGENGLVLKHPAVSREHIRIFLEDGLWQVEHLGKPFSLNDNPTSEGITPILSGDVISIAPFDLYVTVDYPPKLFLLERQGRKAAPREFQLDEIDPMAIGSDASMCKVVIADAAARHAVVFYRPKSAVWWLTDCGSPDGIMINGKSVIGGQLFPGDRISIAGDDIFFDFGKLKIGGTPYRRLDITIDDVSVTKGDKKILKNICCSIHSGEFVGVLGPSGCGKSSLIQRLVGLGTFDSGEIRVNGTPYCEKKHEIQSITSYVPQDVALHNDLTLREEIKIFRLLHLLKDAKFDEKVTQTLRLVGLNDKLDSRVGDLSGGEKRRASIALELLRNPLLLALDEPTAGLDPATETDIMRYLRRIANQGRTVICSTHLMGNMDLFDKILFMAQGKEIFFGSPRELLHNFHVDSPLELYQRFGTATETEIAAAAKSYRESRLFKKNYVPDNTPDDIPSSAAMPSPLQQMLGYLLRQILEYFSFRHTKDTFGFFKSAVFKQTILLPFLTAVVLKTACAKYFFDGADVPDMAFFIALAVFWFGLNSNIRELVRERTPWRCLERMEHVPLYSYLAAKAAWAILMGAAQLAVFSLVIFSPPFLLADKFKDPPMLQFTVQYLPIWFAVSMIGAGTALAISAMSKKENQAIVWLPIILIPVLFFSVTIMRQDGEHYPPALTVQKWMPCHEPRVLVDKIIVLEDQKIKKSSRQDMDKQIREINKSRRDMAAKSGIYIIVALMLMILFQDKNEREWEGRQ